jgi:hypothetical protein
MSTTSNGSALFAGQERTLSGRTIETDEWGNVTETRVFYIKGNAILGIAGTHEELNLDNMATDATRNILSRSATFDEASQITELQERRVIKYAQASRKRISVEAQSSTENIQAHPKFQDLAGTPDEPKENNALWVTANNTEQTKRFVEFKKSGLVGVSSYIAGTGSTLRVTYFDTWTNFKELTSQIGTTDFPDVDNLWGTSRSWLLAGANAEPFGTRWKITLLYKNASENFGQYENGAWSPQIYG